MRRERRKFNNEENSFKRVLYIAGGILSISVIAFIAVFILYGGTKQENTEIAKFNTSIIDEYESNTVEETSSQMGKTVNEMENETETESVNNEISNEVNSMNSEDSSEEEKKYAVNTSKTEDKNVEQSQEQENTIKSKEVKENEDKDPEFIKPVEGDILRKFAQDDLIYSTTLDEWVTHGGIDIKAEKTTVVKASAEGKVKSIKNDPRYGLTVVIEHQNGFSSVYSNLLTAEFIEEGENVKQGQTIATVGNTATFEIADESHLHFEILKNNESIDPELYLK